MHRYASAPVNDAGSDDAYASVQAMADGSRGVAANPSYHASTRHSNNPNYSTADYASAPVNDAGSDYAYASVQATADGSRGVAANPSYHASTRHSNNPSYSTAESGNDGNYKTVTLSEPGSGDC